METYFTISILQNSFQRLLYIVIFNFSSAEIPIQGSQVENPRVAQRSTQPFILIWGTPSNWLKVKPLLVDAAVLRQLHPIHKNEQYKVFFEIFIHCKDSKFSKPTPSLVYALSPRLGLQNLQSSSIEIRRNSTNFDSLHLYSCLPVQTFACSKSTIKTAEI